MIERTGTREIVSQNPNSDGSQKSAQDPNSGGNPEIIIPSLITKNENGTHIQSIKLRPVCRENKNAAELYFKVSTLPTDYNVQVKEVGKSYQSVLQKIGVYENYIYFIFCDSCRTDELKLSPGKAYIVKLIFNQTANFDKMESSNEYLIDARNNSEYMVKQCEGDKVKIERW